MQMARLDPELLRAWDAEQAALEARVVEADPPHGAISIPSDDDDSAAHGSGHDRPLRLVGGLDVSFASDAGAEGDTESAALAALVVLSFPALEVVYEDFLPVRLTQPYVAGYLAFREAPALIDLVRRLRAQRPDMLPELMMVDGNGVLHPRGCGLACHVGLAIGLPTIGVAKTFLHVDGLDAHGVRRAADALQGGAQDWLPLVGQSGRTWGIALHSCSHAGPTATSPPVRNPIYVSVGTGVSLSTAVSIVRACCRHRVPEPIRQADIRSRARIREMAGSEGKKAMNG